MITKRRIKKAALYGVIFLVLFFVLSIIEGALNENNTVTVEYTSKQYDRFQVFFLHNSKGDVYTEKNSAEAEMLPGYEFVTTPVKSLEEFGISSERVRLDTGDLPHNEIAIRRVQINTGYNKYEYTADDIVRLLESGGIVASDIELVGHDNGVAYFETHSNDSWLEFFPRKTAVSESTLFYKERLIHFGICFIAAMVLTYLIYRHVYLRDFVTMAVGLKKNRSIIARMALNDFKSKYASSYLGRIWAFVQPLCTILIYWFVFEVGLRASSMSDIPYSLWLTAGLVPWFFFTEAWVGMSGVFLDYSYLVKKVMFNLDTMPFIRLLSSLITHGFFLIIMFAVYMIYGYFPSIWVLQLFYYVIALCCWLVAISFVTASIMVFIRDVGQVINIINQFGMWLTPILWSIDIFPFELNRIFKLNPMYYIVQGYRDSMLADRFILLDDIKWTLYFWTITIVVLFIGVSMFRKLKVHFADAL